MFTTINGVWVKTTGAGQQGVAQEHRQAQGSVGTFEELHQLVADCTKHIDRFGVLARYDISLRIGANLGIWPEIVYLHAGTKKGCKKLGVPFKGKTVEMSALPKPVQRLKPHHADNFLCIYKGSFGSIGDTSNPIRKC